MLLKLNIITPLLPTPQRINNLYIIKNDIEEEINKLRFEIKWYVFFDIKNKFSRLNLNYKYTTLIVSEFIGSHKGCFQRNFALDLIYDGFVCFMDDDNKFHPNYFDRIYNYINGYSSDYDFFVYEQLRDDCPDGILKVNPSAMKPLNIDGHQITFKREKIGNYKWNNTPYGDGEFIETIFSKHPEKFYFINEPICYHNYLVPKPKRNASVLMKIKNFIKYLKEKSLNLPRAITKLRMF